MCGSWVDLKPCYYDYYTIFCLVTSTLSLETKVAYIQQASSEATGASRLVKAYIGNLHPFCPPSSRCGKIRDILRLRRLANTYGRPGAPLNRRQSCQKRRIARNGKTLQSELRYTDMGIRQLLPWYFHTLSDIGQLDRYC